MFFFLTFASNWCLLNMRGGGGGGGGGGGRSTEHNIQNTRKTYSGVIKS